MLPPIRPSFILTDLVGGARVADCVYPAGFRYPPHVDGRARISVVLRGGLREETRRGDETATASSVVVKPADARHQNLFGPVGARLLSVDLAPAHLDGALGGWRWLHAGPTAAAALRLARAVHERPEEAADDLWALLAAVLPPPSREPTAVAPWLAQARERMDDEPTAAPSVAALAADADVHPVSLARAFRRAFGVAPTTYRRRLRVRVAADLLASTDAPAAHVALDAGFADQSHLCRELRAELGLTPGQLRALA
ncbi:helix-turn-helix domain-containing protein [Rubrivirga sp. IMCC43871]|uniref:AraC family transcriptional regulator n=1 Tax=Rubrivirga sp. IMCC43871 TaxID=3391575 RepID=UPI0039902D81